MDRSAKALRPLWASRGGKSGGGAVTGVCSKKCRSSKISISTGQIMTIRQIRAVNLLRLYVPTLVELSTNLLPRLMVAEQEADKQWLCNLLHARTGRLDIANKVSVCGHTAGDIKKSVKEVAALKEHAAAQCKDFCQENNMYLWPADFWSPQSSSLVPCFGLDRPLFGVQDAPHARHGCRCPPRPPLRITGGKVKGLYSKVVCLPR